MAAECCLQRRKHKLVPGGRGASGDGCFVAEGDRDEAKEQFLHPPPCGSAGEESACNAGDLGFIPGLGRSPGEGNSYPLQCSGLENSMDCIVHGAAKSWTQLSDFHFTSLPKYE